MTEAQVRQEKLFCKYQNTIDFFTSDCLQSGTYGAGTFGFQIQIDD